MYMVLPWLDVLVAGLGAAIITGGAWGVGGFFGLRYPASCWSWFLETSISFFLKGSFPGKPAYEDKFSGSSWPSSHGLPRLLLPGLELLVLALLATPSKEFLEVSVNLM